MSEQLRVEPALQQSRAPEHGGVKPVRDEMAENMRATVELWSDAAQREQARPQQMEEVMPKTLEVEEFKDTNISVARRLRSGVRESLDAVRRVAVYAYEHPGEVGMRVTKEVGWVGVGMAVKGAVVATGSALGAGAVSIAAAGSAIAVGSVSLIRDHLLLNKEADARELKIAREAKKLKNARELYKKYTHRDAKKDAKDGADESEKSWIGKAYRMVMVDGLTRRGVELAYDVQNLRAEVDAIKSTVSQTEVVARMSEQEILGMLETTSELIYRAQSVEERKETQRTVKELYALLQDKAMAQGKDVAIYREVLSKMMKERQQRFEDDSRKAVMMAGFGKVVDALWKFASGAVLVDAGRGIGNFWQSSSAGESAVQAKSIGADVTRGVYEVPQGSGGSTKVFAKMAPLVDQNVRMSANRVNFAEVEMQVDSYVRMEVVAPAVSIQVEPGQGLFAAMRDSGMSVTEERSARTFLERIAPLAVFNLSQEKLKLLMEIVSKNPNISADQLRTLARAQGIDFDREFGVRTGVIEVPAVERAVSLNVEPLDEGLRMESGQGGGKVLMSPAPDRKPQNGLPMPYGVYPAMNVGSASVSNSGANNVITMPYAMRSMTVGNATTVRAEGVIVPNTMHMNTVAGGAVVTTSRSREGITMPVTGYGMRVAGATIVENPTVEPEVVAIVQPEIAVPVATEVRPNRFMWNGMDLSPERARDLKFRYGTIQMDGKAYNLFNFSSQWTRDRLYSPDFSVPMTDYSYDTYAYDPEKNNVFIFVHSWTHQGQALPGEWLRRMIEGHYDLPIYSEAQVGSRINDIVEQRPTVWIEQDGKSVPMTLTEIMRVSHEDTNSLGSELFSYPGVDSGKVYILFCSGSYVDAYKVFDKYPELRGMPGFPAEALATVNNPSARGDVFMHAVASLYRWMDANAPAVRDEFVKLFEMQNADGRTFNQANMGYARYIVELSPAGQ